MKIINSSVLGATAYTTLCFAIALTAISFALIFFYLKTSRDANAVLKVLSAIVFPFLAVLCWGLLIFQSSGFTFGISMLLGLAVAVIYLLIALVISFVANSIHESNASSKQ